METQIEGDMRDGGAWNKSAAGPKSSRASSGASLGSSPRAPPRRSNAFDIPIDRDTMWRAIAMTDFFAAHAILAF